MPRRRDRNREKEQDRHNRLILKREEQRKKRDDRRDWMREKWENKPRKLLDLVQSSTGFLKWLVIAVATIYGLSFDLSSVLTWFK